MKSKIGRPKRKDNPKKITLSISKRAYQALERTSRFSPSRSAFVENLLLNLPASLEGK
jgi:hypothetical protein